MAERPVLLVAANPVRRDDETPGADVAMFTDLLAWAEGHRRCGGLRPGQGRLACPCGVLAFEIRDPYETTGAAA